MENLSEIFLDGLLFWRQKIRKKLGKKIPKTFRDFANKNKIRQHQVTGLDLEMNNPVTPRENSADTGSSPENLGFCEYENSPKEYFGNKQDYRKTTEEILLRKNLANLDSDTNSVKRVRSASEYISPRKNFRTSPRINRIFSPKKHFGYSPRENIDGSPRISIESSPRKHYGHSPRDNLGDSRENSTKKNNKRSTKLKDFFGETPPDSPKSPEKLQLTTKSKRRLSPINILILKIARKIKT